MSLLILLQAAAQMAWGYFGAAVGAGLATIGAGLGIGQPAEVAEVHVQAVEFLGI